MFKMANVNLEVLCLTTSAAFYKFQFVMGLHIKRHGLLEAEGNLVRPPLKSL